MSAPAWTIAPKSTANVDGAVAVLAEAAAEGGRVATEWPFDVKVRARMLRGSLLSGHVEGWVAYDEDGIVVADFTIFNPGEAEPFFGMVVRASHRRMGIGRALIERALEWARERGKTALRLRVFPDNDPARALYVATGFTEVALQAGAVTRSDGSLADAILMRHALTAT
jgi:GNAT superfamily N-acetyltransferase